MLCDLSSEADDDDDINTYAVFEEVTTLVPGLGSVHQIRTFRGGGGAKRVEADLNTYKVTEISMEYKIRGGVTKKGQN